MESDGAAADPIEMDVTTHSFGSIAGNLAEIQRRVIDALFHVRGSAGPSAFVASVFLPEAQCHVLVAIDPEARHRCEVIVVSRSVDGARVIDRRTADEYEQAVQYVRHILLEFDRRRTVSNLVVTTEEGRVRDVRDLADRQAPSSDG